MHKPGNYSKIFNEQIPLILSRGKNLSKSSAQIHRAAMPNLKHLTSPQALYSKNESLASCVMCLNLEEEKNVRIYSMSERQIGCLPHETLVPSG